MAASNFTRPGVILSEPVIYLIKSILINFKLITELMMRDKL